MYDCKVYLVESINVLNTRIIHDYVHIETRGQCAIIYAQAAVMHEYISIQFYNLENTELADCDFCETFAHVKCVYILYIDASIHATQ